MWQDLEIHGVSYDFEIQGLPSEVTTIDPLIWNLRCEVRRGEEPPVTLLGKGSRMTYKFEISSYRGKMNLPLWDLEKLRALLHRYTGAKKSIVIDAIDCYLTLKNRVWHPRNGSEWPRSSREGGWWPFNLENESITSMWERIAAQQPWGGPWNLESSSTRISTFTETERDMISIFCLSVESFWKISHIFIGISERKPTSYTYIFWLLISNYTKK